MIAESRDSRFVCLLFFSLQKNKQLLANKSFEAFLTGNDVITEPSLPGSGGGTGTFTAHG